MTAVATAAALVAWVGWAAERRAHRHTRAERDRWRTAAEEASRAWGAACETAARWRDQAHRMHVWALLLQDHIRRGRLDAKALLATWDDIRALPEATKDEGR